MANGITFFDWLEKNKFVKYSLIVILFIIVGGLITGKISTESFKVSFFDNTIRKECEIISSIENAIIRIKNKNKIDMDEDVVLILNAYSEKFEVYLKTIDPCKNLNQSTISSEIESLNKMLANYE